MRERPLRSSFSAIDGTKKWERRGGSGSDSNFYLQKKPYFVTTF